MSFYQWQGKDLVLYVKIQPSASSDALAEIINHAVQHDQIKIRLTSPPVEGKANKQLISFLSTLFSVGRSQIELLSGQSSRNKKVLIRSPQSLPDLISEDLT